MNDNKKGYWIYSIVVIVFCVGLFAFWGYLIYDLILKLSAQDFSNNTVVQALFSLVTTVFLGGYFTKLLERKNAKKMEVFRVQRDISLNVIDLSTILFYHPNDIRTKELLKAEAVKVKLYFDNEVLKALNEYISADDASTEIRESLYEELSKQLKKSIK